MTDEQAEEQLFGVSTDPSAAGAQLARLLSGEVLGIVGRRVGLDTLRLEQGGSGGSVHDPTLIAGDVDPAFAPHARRAARRQRRARVFTESRRERVHLDHDLLRGRSACRFAGCCWTIRVVRSSSGTNRALARRVDGRIAHQPGGPDRRRALHGKSWLPGARAARAG